jgi:hypothetical protein
MNSTNDKIIKVNLITLIPQSNNNILYLMNKKFLVSMSQQELNNIQSSINTSGVFDTSTYKTSPHYLSKPVFKKILNNKSLKVKNKILVLSALVVGDKPDKQQISYNQPTEKNTYDVNISFIMGKLINGIIHYINRSCIINLRYSLYALFTNQIICNDFPIVNSTHYYFNYLAYNKELNELDTILKPLYYIIKVDIIE